MKQENFKIVAMHILTLPIAIASMTKATLEGKPAVAGIEQLCIDQFDMLDNSNKQTIGRLVRSIMEQCGCYIVTTQKKFDSKGLFSSGAVYAFK